MGLVELILNLLFPPRCVSCKKEGDFLCKNCVQEFRVRRIKAKSSCPSSADFLYLDGVIYGADYAENPGLQAAIAQFKYKFTQPLTAYFSELLSWKLGELGMVKGRPVFLIPVPLHRKRLNYRGFNQAELIARAVANRFSGASLVYPLCRVRHTSQQAKLNKAQRHRNLDEAFEVTGDLKGLADGICFLVDDVCTTGATLDSCARELKKAGLSKVYGLVVARAFK